MFLLNQKRSDIGIIALLHRRFVIIMLNICYRLLRSVESDAQGDAAAHGLATLQEVVTD